MAKLKEMLLRQEEHRREINEAIQRDIKRLRELHHAENIKKHKLEEQQWTEDSPDLEGEALADAEKQFDYDSWMGEHGIGEATVQDEVNPYLFNPTGKRGEWREPLTLNKVWDARNKHKHGGGD